MDQSALFAAIDRATTRVARAELQWLEKGISRANLTEKVRGALSSLVDLQQGVPPDYNDPWVALFYLTWYQPRQIYYARHLINMMNQNRSGNPFMSESSHTLHVVDFGCGCLAMQFAIAWAGAEALEKGLKTKQIRIDSYDAADSMVILGRTLWESFKEQIKDDARFRHLALSASLIEPRYGNPNSLVDFGARATGEERWLSALHTVYENNLDLVRQGLANIASKFQPDIGMMSCYPNDKPIGLLRQASPFGAQGFRSVPAGPGEQTEASLCRVTEWRRSLSERISGHSFLNREVPWTHPAFGLTYTRQV